MVSVIHKINQLNGRTRVGNEIRLNVSIDPTQSSQPIYINIWDEFDAKSYDPISFIYAEILKQLVSDGDRLDNTEMTGVFYNPLGVKPAISIVDYMKRLVTFLGCSYSCFIISLIYIDRMLKKEYTLNSYNVHRFVFGCVLVSIKFYDDYFYPTNVYARVGGVSVKETNEIERKILEELEFNIVVNEFEYNHYLSGIDERGYIISDIMNQQEEPEESDTEESEDTTLTTDESEDCIIPKSASTGASSSSLASSTNTAVSLVVSSINEIDNSNNIIKSTDTFVQQNQQESQQQQQQQLLHNLIEPMSTIDILSKSSGIDIPRGPLSTRSRSLSNSYDMAMFKSRCPQLFISPSLKHRYRRNSYNQKLLNSTSSGTSEMNQSH
ncbi:hypothetical protein PPL_08160 [Heterostelium album PN500]|uniref:Cyclin n=1 Tax=Heterostelium pallidum (strain ATCC 26659 / Pp 5 / PN500) TaxID=670386 RepID=D3BIS5_HETP5|nr:hypothetical protein PPL_08160 [Heterostelium album PN500]EFA78699.1 hypothetical protein PPL_08160 [Heterostelium album PN500]|eukprot:XP_020430823.1 hypothetical protein PPL_08160 [Heterostelium album PN500]